MTEKIAIHVSHLGKKYNLGGPQERYHTIRDTIVNSMRAPTRVFHKAPPVEGFWALKDISFDVEQGEVVGFIGRNGAGKSTLLKILSRITTPTEGIADIYGRVGSLLEVGTGFHPELTGRENIYLSGSILGMKRSEIDAKMDDIVKFSEIEKFLDTPVKRFSSGMYIRLAFAVAAHLEPEILLVDEVLAVGDMAFQKKCLGKMGEVAKEGRTVLFVSHNMAAIEQLCSRIILLKEGILCADGNSEVIQVYSQSLIDHQSLDLNRENDLDIIKKDYRFTRIWFEDLNGKKISIATTGKQFVICMELQCNVFGKIPNIAFTIYDSFNCPVAYFDTEFSLNKVYTNNSKSLLIKCIIPKLPLNCGEYHVNFLIHKDGDYIDHLVSAVSISVDSGDYFGTGKVPPSNYIHILIDHEWLLINEEKEHK
jgi:lipopolysaccharide transport system ATP-binding protein